MSQNIHLSNLSINAFKIESHIESVSMISGGEKKFNEVAVNDAKKKVLFLLL